ncbi:MAG TPA: dockerin type I domain-containing protein [Lacipirellulaceae bacterium]|nr:dockerin type I domain-containing protein [Lacipirellulaceae bacterium]
MKHTTRPLSLMAALWLLAAAPAWGLEQWQTDVGLQRLIDVLGPSLPVGAGVHISQVESADGSGNYFPSTGTPEFAAGNDPLGQAVTFIDGTGTSTLASGHSNQVGSVIYGNALGLATGAPTVTMYEANAWLQHQIDYDNNESQTPVAQPFDVQNHSWIGTFNSAALDLGTLRRFDYMIETGDMTAVVGANNNFGTPNPALAHPALMVHSYNAIVAGLTDSRHSRGATSAVYGTGRFRPDLVAPAMVTSYATGYISGAAAVLRGAVANTAADRSEPIKALLLAGATKTEFLPGAIKSEANPDGPANVLGFVEAATGLTNNWNQLNTLPTDAGNTRPLDDLFGAGELNLHNSYLMTVGGQTAGVATAPAAPVDAYGWDYRNRKADATAASMYYNFEVPAGSTARELSIVLTWNVKITDSGEPGFQGAESLQDLNLKFYDSSASFLGQQLLKSNSAVDNVEHIYATNLGPGTYTLEVTGSQSWDYGLAWRTSTLFDVVDADFDGDGLVNGSDFVLWQRGLGTLVGATNAQGDADGDGDVDRTDLTILTTALSAPPMALPSIAAVPEPGCAALAAGALAAWGAWRRQRVDGQRQRGNRGRQARPLSPVLGNTLCR